MIYLFVDQQDIGGCYVSANSIAQAVQRMTRHYRLSNIHIIELGNGKWSFAAQTEHMDFIEHIIHEFNENTAIGEF